MHVLCIWSFWNILQLYFQCASHDLVWIAAQCPFARYFSNQYVICVVELFLITKWNNLIYIYDGLTCLTQFSMFMCNFVLCAVICGMSVRQDALLADKISYQTDTRDEFLLIFKDRRKLYHNGSTHVHWVHIMFLIDVVKFPPLWYYVAIVLSSLLSVRSSFYITLLMRMMTMLLCVHMHVNAIASSHSWCQKQNSSLFCVCATFSCMRRHFTLT